MISLAFIDVNNNPLPPGVVVQVIDNSETENAGTTTATVTLHEGGAYTSVQTPIAPSSSYAALFSGTQAPSQAVTFSTDENGMATVTVPDYASPSRSAAGYLFEMLDIMPRGWFPDEAKASGGILYAMEDGVAQGAAALDAIAQTALASMRVGSLHDALLDSFVADFLGTKLPRLAGETNEHYAARFFTFFDTKWTTLEAINDAISAFFATDSIGATSIVAFDRVSDPERAAYYGLASGEIGILAYYPPSPTVQGWYMGQKFLGQTTYLTNPYSFTSYRSDANWPAQYRGLLSAILTVSGAGFPPVLIVALGDPF